MNRRLYVAYGSNLNKAQMRYRCPTAELFGTGTLKDYELQFKGHPTGAFATIAPKEGSSVPVAVWEIGPIDERNLDRYEGYPTHYFKEDVPVEVDGEQVTAMVYIMNQRMQFGMPSPQYYATVHEGYNDCGLDTAVLDKAVARSAQKFYSSVVRLPQQLGMDGYDEYDSDEDPDEDEDEDLDEDPDEDELSHYFGVRF